MKKLNLLTIIIMLAVASVSFGQGIAGTAHDLSGAAWNSSGEICITCHTPHDAMDIADSPLWNHEVSTANYTLYSGQALDATDLAQPDGSSKLCLSCHDGTIALDSFGGATGSTNITGGHSVGTDLSHEHPISFTYNTALATADGELFDPSTATSSLGGTIADDMLVLDQLQCSSCHDAHDKAGNNKFLLISNAGSALCLTCHNK
jgi:predicted CXXCH cytochrome family protein